MMDNHNAAIESTQGEGRERDRDRYRETEREDLSLLQSCWSHISSEKKRGFTFHHPTVHCDKLFLSSNKNRKHTKAENAVHKTRKKGHMGDALVNTEEQWLANLSVMKMLDTQVAWKARTKAPD